MEIVVIANQKGGAGKTTTALNLAYGLAMRGKKVLAIDMDGQCNLSFLLGTDSAALMQSEQNIYSVLLGKKAIGDCIVPVYEHIDLIPGSQELYEADMTLTKVGKEYRLKKALGTLSGYDAVIVDTCPSLGILTVNAFTAADRVIIPMQAELLSMVGMQQLLDTLSAVREYCNPDFIIDGILLCRYQGRARLSKDFSEAIHAQAEQLQTKVYRVPIRESITVKESQSMRQPVYSYAPKATVTEDFIAFIDEFTEGEHVHGK